MQAVRATSAIAIATSANQKMLDQGEKLIAQSLTLTATAKEGEAASLEAKSVKEQHDAVSVRANHKFDVQSLIEKMHSDDATAYDKLQSMTNVKRTLEKPRDIQRPALSDSATHCPRSLPRRQDSGGSPN